MQKVILASASPRRKELLALMGIKFENLVIPIEESFPDDLDLNEVPIYLSLKKLSAFNEYCIQYPESIVITADTIVKIDNTILNKPLNKAEATAMLHQLSGNTHEVITGFAIRQGEKYITASDIAEVHFNEIPPAAIQKYIETGSPFDKAGAYGVQDWLGLNYIKSINGSFYTVMGLPTSLLFNKLQSEFGLEI